MRPAGLRALTWVPVCGQMQGGALGSRAPCGAPAALPGLWCMSARLFVTSLPSPCILLPMSFRTAAGMWFHLFSDCWDGGGIVTVGVEGRRLHGGAALCLCPGAGRAAVTPSLVPLAAAPALVSRLQGRGPCLLCEQGREGTHQRETPTPCALRCWTSFSPSLIFSIDLW